MNGTPHDPSPAPAPASALHARVTVVDVHAHPSLKLSLFGLRFGHRHRPGGAFNPLSLRCDLPKLVAGGVNVLCSAVYVPERGLLDDCVPLRLATPLIPSIHNLITGDPFRGAMRVLDDFERALAATEPLEGVRPVAAHTRADLDAALGRGDLAIVHTLEGAHHLSGFAGNVARFFDRGVALLTLAHFYENGAAPPIDGIPPAQKHLGCFRSPKDLSAGLTALGRDVIGEMVRLGMIVDLTHATPVARREALEQVGTRRPVVMSHVGAGTIHPDPMNPTEDEVRRIGTTGGVVGVIAMDYWLGGTESRGSGGRSARSGNGGSADRSGSKADDGIGLMVRTMRALADQGGIDVVALGTDFDGFTDPPDDLPDPESLPRLTDALLEASFTETEIEKILGENVLRVLREGWGR